MAVLTWDIAPDYDKWGIDSFWSCDEWVQWHKQLKAHFGQEKANEIWNYAFAQSQELSSNLDCPDFNTIFRDYVAKNGLKPQVFGGGKIGDVIGSVGSVADIFTGTLKGVSSFFSGSSVKTILNVVAIGGAIFGGLYIYRTFKK